MAHSQQVSDADATDPGLLKDNSEVKSYTTKRFTYPGVRVFFRARAKINELPRDPAPLPLLVFVHGLGGSVAQFHPLLTSLSNHASCLAVDLPGCGRSAFAPEDWEAYSTDALTDLLEVVIDDYRDKDHDQGIILIAHSMGTVLAARLANKRARHVTNIASYVMGVVGICPVAQSLPKEKVAQFRNLLRIPTWLFNLWRMWDQWGGPESASVKRFVGPDADLVSKQLQHRFNRQSRSPVFRRVAWGSLPTYVGEKPVGGLFGEPTWAGLDVPVLLIGGGSDLVTSPKEVEKIAAILHSNRESLVTNGSSSSGTIAESAAPIAATAKPSDHLPESIDAITDDDFKRREFVKNAEESMEEPTTPRDASETPAGIPPQPRHPKKVVKTVIMPNATHALLYAPKTHRTVSGLISDFMSEHITGRLDFAWQLQHLNREGKWEMKNLAKWKAIQPVSKSINGIFRAMKTLREGDEDHSPQKFAADWGHIVKDIIDISKDNPAYSPNSLPELGIKYHKFATVSKIPPTDAEVTTFVHLVDQVRQDQQERAHKEGWKEYAVGVHCHYGFNRTGYFIVCYLVDRCGLDVQQAIEMFAEARPNGIRHSHFLDRLYRRYSGLDV
ncbi:hypothetical protein JX265_012250 [Neoarthrinium moseri]|uniref:Tyrosine specific protein phosphatases domain-containing protein n=1 Tax=Neoarthrinium moseri TaxID=1658444 RepID=A0A9Q0AJP4_9PEZI|nr:hypothetical protein JX265_012250 [Neoarthrinium moseri]